MVEKKENVFNSYEDSSREVLTRPQIPRNIEVICPRCNTKWVTAETSSRVECLHCKCIFGEDKYNN